MKLVIMLLCSFIMSAANAAVYNETVRVVKMPSACVLQEDLKKAGFADFAKNSGIVSKLAGYWLSESQARLRTKRCIAAYIANYKIYAEHMRVNECALYKVTLQAFST